MVAFNIYCRIPFGKFHNSNPEIIKYSNLIDRTPSALSMKLCNIASLDPEIFLTSRKGLTGASNTDKKMWDEMQKDWEGFIEESEIVLENLDNITHSKLMDHSINPIEELEDYTGHTKTSITQSRLGQPFFRKAVLSSYDYKCCITGLSDPKLLRAGHIVPWKDDNENRLNPRNGLSLSILHERAFDLGLFTINDDLTICISDIDINKNDTFYAQTLVKYHGKSISLPQKFQPNLNFLAYHRKNIFNQKEN